MNTDPSKIRNRKSRIPWLLTAPTLLFVLAVWLDVTPWLRGPDEWRWTLRPLEWSVRLIIPIVILSLYTVLCARRLSAFEVRSTPFLVFLTLAAPLIQLALAASVSRQPLLAFFGPTVSVHNSGYFSTAIATPELNDLLAHYPAIMPTLPIHAQSHPPGPIVMQWLGWRFFEAAPALADAIALPLRALQCHNAALMTLDNPQIASAAVGMLVPLIGGLAVWPMWAFGRRVAGPKAALAAVALFPILPLFAMWPSQWDQLYPLLLFASLYLAHTGLEMRSGWRMIAAGVPLSIATFFSVGNILLIVIVGLYGLAWTIYNHKDTKTQSSVGACVPSWSGEALAFASSCASIWIVYALLYRVNPLDVIATGSRLAFESTTGPRSYGLWVVWNLIDFAIFLGAPIVILLLARVRVAVASIRTIRESSRIGTHAVTELPVRARILSLAVATLVTLAALNLSGIVRGEVGRLWIYFGPLLILLGLASIESPRQNTWSHGWLIGLVALQLLTMNTRWLVNDSFLDEPPDRLANFATPHPSIETQASFDRQIALRGYDVRASGASIDLTLYWQALAQPPHAYTVFVHVLDAAGQAVGQKDNMPVHDRLPTSCWQPGEYVTDPYTIPLSAGARGPFSIEVGLYRFDTGERLSVQEGAGTSITLVAP